MADLILGLTIIGIVWVELGVVYKHMDYSIS